MRNLKPILGLILIILTIPVTLYVAIWWGIIQPILNIAEAIDTDTLSAGLIAKNVIHFFLREVAATVVAVLGWGAGTLLMQSR